MTEPLQLGFTALLTAEERARELLKGDTQISLTDSERLVLRELLFHIGHTLAIPRTKLQEKFQLAEREVKEVIRNLIVTHSVAIGASRGKDHGYFLVADNKDLEIAGQPLISELTEIARRLKVLYGPHRVAELYGQLTLEQTHKETA